MKRAADTMQFAARAAAADKLGPGEGAHEPPDGRFAADAWSQYPFNVYARAFHI